MTGYSEITRQEGGNVRVADNPEITKPKRVSEDKSSDGRLRPVQCVHLPGYDSDEMLLLGGPRSKTSQMLHACRRTSNFVLFPPRSPRVEGATVDTGAYLTETPQHRARAASRG